MGVFMKQIVVAAAVTLAMLLGSNLSAQAGYVVTLEEQGTSVFATGSGALDLTGLSTGELSGSNLIGIVSNVLNPTRGFGAYILTGPPVPPGTEIALFNTYSGTGIIGPMNFGGQGFTFASSGSGDLVGINSTGFGGEGGFQPGPKIIVPVGYISGDPVSDSSTYLNQSFASLGVLPGTYEWTWGTGADQNFTVVVGTPEPASGLLLGVGIAALLLVGTGHRIRSSRISN
jgi:hypothetical protein